MRTRTAYRLLFGLFAVFLVFAVPFAITGTGEDRRTALGIVAVAATIAGLTWLDREFRVEPRRRAAEAAGEMLGLRPSGDDSWVRALGFDLLRARGTVQDVTNVLEGMWRGQSAATFEYRWATEDTERRYSCALLPVPTSWPRLAIMRESTLTRLARDAGVGDVETEWEAFNRAFRVTSGDARFASSILDGRMMEWLIARSPIDGFEIAEGRLLVYTAQVYPWEIERVLEIALEFQARIPAVVSSLFGGAAPSLPPRPDAGSSSG